MTKFHLLATDCRTVLIKPVINNKKFAAWLKQQLFNGDAQ